MIAGLTVPLLLLSSHPVVAEQWGTLFSWPTSMAIKFPLPTLQLNLNKMGHPNVVAEQQEGNKQTLLWPNNKNMQSATPYCSRTRRSVSTRFLTSGHGGL